MISFRDVTLRRGGFRLDVPRLDVEPGTIVGLVGRNGAGKTTLLELCVGLLAPDAGEVRAFGLDPVRDPVGVRRRVALMTDDMPLFHLRIGALMRALAPFWPTWDPDLARRLVETFELDPGKSVAALSKGEHTRLRLALSLAWKPDVVLLDEPATGLDVPSRRKMLGEVLGIVRDPARAVVISSHDVADVERIADRLVVLDRGRVVADGPTREVVGEGRTLEEMLAGMGA
ncbi:MAG: ABC transporter ATP-binding protein [Myxococcota bacterium]